MSEPTACSPPSQLLQEANTEGSSIIYSPLNEDQDEIRLITILPATGSSLSIVQCSLETVSLKSYTIEFQAYLSTSDPQQDRRKTIKEWLNACSTTEGLELEVSGSTSHQRPSRKSQRFTWGDYAALSYVWGDSAMTQKIIVNNKDTYVGEKLVVALRALRERAEFINGYKLWVDAICINQYDLEERSRQIGRMKNIYSDAWAVIAWVGEEADHSNEAIQLVQTLSNLSEEGRGDDVVAKLNENPFYLGDGSWTALHEFMDRTYWRRLWIIQEIVLGSSVLDLRCGNASIDWLSFCRGIGFLQDYLWTVKDTLFYEEALRRGLPETEDVSWSTASLHLVYKNLWPLSYREDKSREYLSFTQLLDVANAADSHDLRDKVYGLAGLMDPLISRQLVPNYRWGLHQVFANIAKIFILTSGNLEPLRDGHLWHEILTPSWAADWVWNGRLRYSRPETKIWGQFWVEKGRPALAQPAPPYCASGNERMEIAFSNNDMQLTCRGFLIDEIDGLSARQYGYFHWEKESIIQPTPGRNVYGNVNEIAKALVTTLVIDRVAGGQKATSRHAAILNLPAFFEDGEQQFKDLGWTWLSTQEGYYFRWEEWRVANRRFQLMGRSLDDYFTDIIPIDASEYDYSEVYSCFDRTSKGRRFMTTKEGYMGWAPDNIYGEDEDQTRKGDLIAIIFGCSTPLVIRPYGKLWQVVGEAYVQGLMDGEAMESLRNGRFQVRDFTFC